MSSIRQLAGRAGIKPNTFVRLSHAVGLAGFEEMRELFREDIRNGQDIFPDRARMLQEASRRGQLDQLYVETAHSLRQSLEALLASQDHKRLRAVARKIVEARHCYVLGVGIAQAVANTFAYVAGMAIERIEVLPKTGMIPVDGLAHAGPTDLLVAMTFHPYRNDVIDAIQLAHAKGVPVIAISDSLASPIMPGALQQFVVPVGDSSFFLSTVALTALFEMLVAFVVAETGTTAVEAISEFHLRRYEFDVYHDSPSEVAVRVTSPEVG
jgi:DNA-binding MurR/RpiR family transcriptional regulator